MNRPDVETRQLARLLRRRARLRDELADSDRALKLALRTWSDSRPGERGGIATEAGATFLLGRIGLL